MKVISYTIQDAVKASGLSRSTLYNLINDRKLESRVVCGRRLILADSLAALVNGETLGAEAR